MTTESSTIIVGGECLYGLDGVYVRFEERLEDRKHKQGIVSNAEKRHILIGEVGEAAIILDLQRRGFEVDHLSRSEFVEGIDESSTDIIARKDGRELKIQVKASEAGNRCIENHLLTKYERDGVDLLVFVAVRDVPDFRDEAAHFVCSVTTAVQPPQVRVLGSWYSEFNRWIHINNEKFMKKWLGKTKEQIELAARAM